MGDILSNIEHIVGSEHNDWLTGDSGRNTFLGRGGDDRIEGGAGNDRLWGQRGADTLLSGAGTDTYDVAGDTMTLQFGHAAAADFRQASNNFNRDGNNLVITIDKDSTDGIDDKVTIVNAYDTDPTTGTGNSAFTINIEYGIYTFTEMTNEFWHTLT